MTDYTIIESEGFDYCAECFAPIEDGKTVCTACEQPLNDIRINWTALEDDGQKAYFDPSNREEV